MSRPRAIRRFGASRRLLPALAFLAISTAAALGVPPPETHTLKGVVYKSDGTPAAGVKVTMAQREIGYIFIGDDCEIWAYGPDEKRLFFLPKRNGKTVCEAATDAQGCFTLERFVSTTARYSIVAGSKDAGLAVVENVKPSDYADKPLRIDIDAPAYLRLPRMPKSPDSELESFFGVSFAPRDESAADGEKAAAAKQKEPHENVVVRLYVMTSPDEGSEKPSESHADAQSSAAESGNGTDPVGPLVGGRRYLVTQYVSGPRLQSFMPTVFETAVTLESGKTIPIHLPNEGGAELSGRIATKEGSPLGDVNVLLRAGNPGVTLGALTDKDGVYTIRHAPPGDHKLELLRHAIRVGPG